MSDSLTESLPLVTAVAPALPEAKVLGPAEPPPAALPHPAEDEITVDCGDCLMRSDDPKHLRKLQREKRREVKQTAIMVDAAYQHLTAPTALAGIRFVKHSDCSEHGHVQMTPYLIMAFPRECALLKCYNIG